MWYLKSGLLLASTPKNVTVITEGTSHLRLYGPNHFLREFNESNWKHLLDSLWDYVVETRVRKELKSINERAEMERERPEHQGRRSEGMS